ncbi:MAG TPA: zinc-binding alcohol dehydrogenase [Xanthobacteraceae bacterium]|nr:zinc-binding alcohol dehydrogenase [Xanthobacteraceae bacterium]
MTNNRDAKHAEALWYVGPGQAEICQEALPVPGTEDVLVRALHGAISRGTERLVFTGSIPASEFERMRAPFMEGAFPFPVKYGYSTVGCVEAGPKELLGRTVFALHPHQSAFVLPINAVVPIPDGVPPARAVLAANMETALNAVWDAAPQPADRIAIVGGGVVGLLVARLCAQLPGAEVTVVDVVPSRAAIAQHLGARFALPDAAPLDCDLVVHASATAAGLATALRIAGEEATVLEMSWYGAAEVAVPLGGVFHSRRLRLSSSQVGQVAPSHRARWSHSRRLAAALSLLADPALDDLLAPAIAFRNLPKALPDVLLPASGALCQTIAYAE